MTLEQIEAEIATLQRSRKIGKSTGYAGEGRPS
jgi:hypothetical protein